MLDPKDGGFKSRKLIYAAGTSVIIAALAVLAASKLPALQPNLDATYGALIGTLTVYLTGNIAHKVNIGKVMVKTSQPLTGQPIEQVPEGEEVEEPTQK